MMRGYVYAGLAGLALMAYAAHVLYAAGKEAGKNACEASRARAADTAAAEVDRRAAASADASTSMLDYLRANLPPIESQTHASIERVRTVYRDHPISDSGCVRPAGVQSELDAARTRANAAAGAM